MRMSLAAVAVLAGSLLLPVWMLGSAQAVTSAPDLKNAIGSGTVTLTPVRGGGFAGGGAHMGGFAVRTFHGGPRFAGREFHHFSNRHFSNRHFVNDHHFNHRRVFGRNRFFIAGGPWWWGGSSCWWWNPRWERWVWICG
jgi:hypothetical protein